MFNKRLKIEVAELKEELRTTTIKVNVLLKETEKLYNKIAKIKPKKQHHNGVIF